MIVLCYGASQTFEKKKLAPPIPQTKTISHIFDWLQFTKLVIRVSCETC